MDNDIVGYKVNNEFFEGRACLTCAKTANLDGKVILRKDATDEGRFLTCEFDCMDALDLAGYEAHMTEGLEAYRTYVPPFKSTGDPVADYLIQKGEMADPRG